MGKTAAEFLAELAKNKEYQSMKNAKDAHFSALEKSYAEDELALVKELNNAGFEVQSVWDLANSKNDYLLAEPILVSHLKANHHPKTLSGIARALAVPEFARNSELWCLLVKLYESVKSDADISIPEQRGAQTAIAIALECLATDTRVDSLRKLIAANPNGDGIDWLRRRLKALS
jgi:hypothetical protein